MVDWVSHQQQSIFKTFCKPAYRAYINSPMITLNSSTQGQTDFCVDPTLYTPISADRISNQWESHLVVHPIKLGYKFYSKINKIVEQCRRSLNTVCLVITRFSYQFEDENVPIKDNFCCYCSTLIYTPTFHCALCLIQTYTEATYFQKVLRK